MLWMVWMMASALAADLVSQDLRWFCVNDTVMGGVSSSRVALAGDGVRFSGELSLENNGGFTSVRTQPAELDLGGVTGFAVRVRGDGRSYDFTVRRSDVPIRGGSYRARIETRAGEEQTFRLPLSAFEATAFGRPVSAPPLSGAPERISSVGFLLADKQPGDFSLQILSIEPYTEPDASRAEVGERAPVLAALGRAIERGVPAYNSGDHAGCAAIYRTAIEGVVLLAGDVITPEERALLLRSLTESGVQDATAAAWTLRGAMDVVLNATDGALLENAPRL